MHTGYFLKPHDITAPGKDAKVIMFPFHLVAGEDEPLEEAHLTSDHRIIVSITNDKIIEWRLSDADIEKAMFRFAVDAIIKKIKLGPIPKRLEVVVSSESHPAPNFPFDLAKLPEPDGFKMELKTRGK